ncbi:uncharacterized protein FIBRA_06094 [Fibroporia radiculosa]|uniref:Uncharacterized protein n=1 Tax=Fibroporia radiculosa TaxID=599839 RepID=J4IB29_9APHY|nr:uncharacterized protein FIBRA_06094 [Fibroporia radiculosa]CCM03941.1 predicted protein [Fibroporia radiculosa]
MPSCHRYLDLLAQIPRTKVIPPRDESPTPQTSGVDHQVTSTMHPNTIYFTSSVTVSTAAPSQSSGPPNVNNVLGPLLGGLLGGFFGLIVIVVILWCIWRRRYDIFCRRDFVDPEPPVLDYKQTGHPSRGNSAVSSPEPSRQPYPYGQVGRPLSSISTSTSAHSPTLTPTYSHSPSVLTTNYSLPLSAAPSTLMNLTTTPLPGASTALSPGSSVTSFSRASTPGLVYPAPLLQYRNERQQGRLSWPRYSSSEDGNDESRSSVLRPRSERRPSRLSLTLANWNPETDAELDVMRASDSDERKDSSGIGTKEIDGKSANGGRAKAESPSPCAKQVFVGPSRTDPDDCRSAEDKVDLPPTS